MASFISGWTIDRCVVQEAISAQTIKGVEIVYGRERDA
jgi:hypothetical protein